MAGARISKKAAQDERGQSVLEFVVVLPIIFVFLFLTVEGAILLRTWIAVEHASREGARYAVVRNSTGDVEAFTMTRLTNADSALSGSTVTVTVSGASADPCTAEPGSDVEVSVHYDYTYRTVLLDFLSLAGGGSLPSIGLNGQTHMRLEEGSCT